MEHNGYYLEGYIASDNRTQSVGLYQPSLDSACYPIEIQNLKPESMLKPINTEPRKLVKKM